MGLSYLNTLLATDTVERQHDVVKFKGLTKTTYVAALSTTGTPPQAHSHHVDSTDGPGTTSTSWFNASGSSTACQRRKRSRTRRCFTGRKSSRSSHGWPSSFDMESDKVNTGNLHLAEDAQQALVELTAGDVAYGYYNMTLLALGDTPRQAEAAVDLLGSSLRANGYTVVRERHGLLSALLSSFPGNADSTLRWKLASTANIADLAPMRTISQGETNHPLFSRLSGYNVPPLCRFLTPYGITFDFNPHEGDLGHTIVIGGSGSGETSLTLLIAQFQKYAPSQTFILTKTIRS